jgi:hypothetical protein
MKFFQDFKLQTHYNSFPSFKQYYYDPMLLFLFPSYILGLITVPPPNKKSCIKKNQMIKFHTLKKKGEGGKERPSI